MKMNIILPHLGLLVALLPLSHSLNACTSSKSQSGGSATSRIEFLKHVAIMTAGVTIVPLSSEARGRATLDQTYMKFSPRIRAGGEFYSTDLKKMVAASDWDAIKNSLQEPPKRTKADLVKSDSGVAARARQAGQFSDARVLVAADLFAASFSESSISSKTKKMQASVSKVRKVIQEMQSLSRQALGEESKGRIFGLGSKKPDQKELAKELRSLYVEGGNAWNEYIFEANDKLALQFDKFEFIK